MNAASAAVRVRWLHRLAEIYLERREWQPAWRSLRDALNLSPQDYRTRRALCELAAVRPVESELIECERVLRKAEGETGATWRCLRGLRRLAHAESSADESFSEARELEQQIGQSRQAWPRKLLLRSVLARVAQDQAKEFQALRQLLQLEADGLYANQRLFDLLIGAGRAFEAHEHLQRFACRLDRQSCLDPHGRSSIEQPLSRRGLLALARDDAECDPSSITSGCWLAWLNGAAGQTPTETAAESPHSVADFAARLATHAALGEQGRTLQLLSAIQNATGLPQADRKFLAAQAAALASDPSAMNRLLRLQQRQPRRPGVAYTVAKHASGRQRDLARRALLEAAAGGEMHGRRLLADALAAHGHKAEWNDAWSVLLASDEEAVYPSDQHLARTAALLARGGARELDQTLKLLIERNAAGLPETADDLWLQASLLDLRGQTIDANVAWTRLMACAENDPLYLESFVMSLLNQRRTDEAAAGLQRLEEIEPFRLATLRLRAHYQRQRQQTDDEVQRTFVEQAERLLAQTGDRLARRQLCRDVADVLQEIHRDDAANHWRQRAESGEL